MMDKIPQILMLKVEEMVLERDHNDQVLSSKQVLVLHAKFNTEQEAEIFMAEQQQRYEMFFDSSQKGEYILIPGYVHKV